VQPAHPRGSPDLSTAVLLERIARIAATLRARRHELDAINVYPVADRDTGTNMTLTLEGALDAARSPSPRSVRELLERFPRAALRSARGNSGLLLAAWIDGACDALASSPELTDGVLPPGVVAAALEEAAARSRRAISEPSDGTILSVAEAAATAARASAATDVVEVLGVAADAAADALARTPGQRPELARHGVVDAGGLGLLIVLRVLAGQVPDTEGTVTTREIATHEIATHETATHETATHNGRGGPPEHSGSEVAPAEFEVMLDVEAAGVDDLARSWATIGDSIVLAGGPPVWSGHVHTRRPHAAVTAARRTGRVSNLRIEAIDVRDSHGVPMDGRSAR
jgi:dihydroxyacetone kinase-like predicted kinase